MKYVYLLKSVQDTKRRYIGLTRDIERRLKEHNEGKSTYSAKYAPWEVVVCVKFEDDDKAAEFERYLKSGSGHEFAKRHFW